MNKTLTLVHPYYEAAGTIPYHLDTWLSYPDHIKKNLKIILVDDGSPTQPLNDVLPKETPGLDIEVYRIQVDIPWNQHGARNLGATLATTEWLLMFDIDKRLLFPFMCYVWDTPWESGTFYNFTHYTSALKINEERPTYANQFLLKKDDFLLAGGYDEDFCGTYGGDAEMRSRMEKQCKLVTHYAALNQVPHGRTLSLDRKEYRQKFKDKYAVLKASKQIGVPKPIVRFPWTRVR